jgi:hypothetical protein
VPYTIEDYLDDVQGYSDEAEPEIDDEASEVADYFSGKDPHYYPLENEDRDQDYDDEVDDESDADDPYFDEGL